MQTMVTSKLVQKICTNDDMHHAVSETLQRDFLGKLANVHTRAK